MPLVKVGKIAGDACHVADDAEIPADGAILIPAARFSPMRRQFCARPEKQA